MQGKEWEGGKNGLVNACTPAWSYAEADLFRGTVLSEAGRRHHHRVGTLKPGVALVNGREKKKREERGGGCVNQSSQTSDRNKFCASHLKGRGCVVHPAADALDRSVDDRVLARLTWQQT